MRLCQSGDYLILQILGGWPYGCVSPVSLVLQFCRVKKKQGTSYMAIQTTSIAVSKNCFRCGVEFQADSNERVCASCRKPRVLQRGALSRHLSFREKQIVDLVSQAKANKEIAYLLHLTEGTVKEYLNRIFRKLDVKNRTELAIWALRQQLAA